MIVISMMLSGGVAGLVWLPALFGAAGSYGTSYQSQLGFLGIAVALLGRNRPLGMLFGAVLFAFLSAQSNTLTFGTDVSPSIVQITQGVGGARGGHRLRGRTPMAHQARAPGRGQ